MVAITDSQYRRRTKSWWQGRRVEFLREMTTRNGVRYPAGTKATIEDKFDGFEVRSEPCPHCGVSVSIKKVPANALALVEDANG